MEGPVLDRQQTIANVVLDHSECAEVFQRHHIDFCCRGGISIEAAAEAQKLDPDALLGELTRAIAQRRGVRQDDPRDLTTPQLVAHIVSKHHAYLRKALPFVRALALKVGRVHGDHNPKLRALDAAVGALVDALLPHLEEEEGALFPALTATHTDHAQATRLLDAMVGEHLIVAKLLERIRAASDDFTLPDWACNSYRTLFSELRQLESDIFTHVHLENHVLKPRFAA
ncbi:MAG: DUF542 domain-containing protein [Deltaproteobacteria bacterium]|nr:DUF542 domain-containing protein [Deltaproteobacteria bacterium]